MIMKVNQNQIQQIYTFTQKHYVEWYDVQTELVDHLANGIENQWETNPDRSFEDALNNEFKKFGIFGFQDLVEEKTKALNKYYRKQVWFYLKQFFKLPKIVLTLFSVWALFNVIHFLEHKLILIWGIIFLIFVAHIFHLVKFKSSINKRKNKTGKKWLFEHCIIQLGGLINVLYFVFDFCRFFDSNRTWTITSILIVSITIVMYLLVFYISSVLIPKKLKEEMSKQYPEYKMI